MRSCARSASRTRRPRARRQLRGRDFYKGTWGTSLFLSFLRGRYRSDQLQRPPKKTVRLLPSKFAETRSWSPSPSRSAAATETGPFVVAGPPSASGVAAKLPGKSWKKTVRLCAAHRRQGRAQDPRAPRAPHRGPRPRPGPLPARARVRRVRAARPLLRPEPVGGRQRPSSTRGANPASRARQGRQELRSAGHNPAPPAQ